MTNKGLIKKVARLNGRISKLIELIEKHVSHPTGRKIWVEYDKYVKEAKKKGGARMR